MFDDPLSLPTRISVTLSVLVFALHARRALLGERTGRAAAVDAPTRLVLRYGAVAFVVGAVVSHWPLLRESIMRVFPVGAALGMAVALATFASPTVRARFDALRDGDVRLLLSYRALFGALILALTALGHFPLSFAMTAGIGDLVVGWLALASPASLAARPDGTPAERARSRRWRALVHGVGFADLLQVAYMAVVVVRPWSLEHGNAASSMTLPWVFVPFMFALNLHGIRQVFATNETAASAEPGRDGSEPAGRVRRAVSGA